MSIETGLSEVKARLSAALKAAGRAEGDARLIAVSKTFPAECAAEAYRCGQRAFGENRVQELSEKAPKLPTDVEWHLIGHLQQNKVRMALEHAAWIHSIDSLALLQRTVRRRHRREHGRAIRLFRKHGRFRSEFPGPPRSGGHCRGAHLPGLVLDRHPETEGARPRAGRTLPDD